MVYEMHVKISVMNGIVLLVQLKDHYVVTAMIHKTSLALDQLLVLKKTV